MVVQFDESSYQNSFHITVAGSEGDFLTRLPDPLFLKADEWEVGLGEVSLPSRPLVHDGSFDVHYRDGSTTKFSFKTPFNFDPVALCDAVTHKSEKEASRKRRSARVDESKIRVVTDIEEGKRILEEHLRLKEEKRRKQQESAAEEEALSRAMVDAAVRKFGADLATLDEEERVRKTADRIVDKFAQDLDTLAEEEELVERLKQEERKRREEVQELERQRQEQEKRKEDARMKAYLKEMEEIAQQEREQRELEQTHRELERQEQEKRQRQENQKREQEEERQRRENEQRAVEERERQEKREVEEQEKLAREKAEKEESEREKRLLAIKRAKELERDEARIREEQERAAETARLRKAGAEVNEHGFAFHYHNGRVSLLLTNGDISHITLTDSLAYILGYEERELVDGSRAEFDVSIDFANPLFIHTDIIQPSMMGETYASLLRMIPLSDSIHNVQYHPLKGNVLQYIRIMVRDINGRDVTFPSGNIVCVLAFRRRSHHSSY